MAERRYIITESVGTHVEAVHRYEDLEKHHPSSGRESGREYRQVDGRLEEIRPLGGGDFLVKKDFILHDSEGAHRVDIPSPAAGYVYFDRAYGTAAIYDAPRPGGHLVANVLHMDPSTFRFRNGEHVEYGQGLGVQGGTGRDGTRHYGIHAHVEARPDQFLRYIADLESGVIRPGQYSAAPEAPEPVRPEPAPSAGARAFPPGGAIGQTIASGEGNYNSFNRGRAGDARGAEIDFSQMTVNEVMRRQALPPGDPDRLFAVGKYQIIPGTMAGAVATLGIDANERLTPELQERLFGDYLITHKRPAIRNYVTGESDDRTGALHDTALEWASVGDPERGGLSHYGGTGNNHASITPARMGEALDQARRDYREMVAGGMTEDAAWHAITGQGEAAQRVPPVHGSRDGNVQGSNGQVLRLGATGPQVQALQEGLRQLGADLEPDGRFGPQTERAVKGYQTMVGLEPDGVAGPATLGALQRAAQGRAVAGEVARRDAPSENLLQAPALRSGDQGPLVQELQTLLVQRGAKLEVDGRFGPDTERALRGYQLMNGIDPEGALGLRTKAALQSDALDLRSERAPQGTPQMDAPAAERSELVFARPEQLDQYEAFLGVFGPALAQRGFSNDQIDTLATATVGHLAANARLGSAEQYFLSEDGSRIAVRHPNHVFTELSVDEALNASAQDHLDSAARMAGQRLPAIGGEQSLVEQWQEVGQAAEPEAMARA